MGWKDDDDYEEYSYFEGPCTCLHDEDLHGWGCCDVEDCPCEAGWAE